MHLMKYNARAWYWTGKPAGQSAPIVYSSATGKVVDSGDPAYVAWKNRGGVPSPWPKDENDAITVAALDDELTRIGQTPTGISPLTKTQLRKSVNQRASAALASGAATMGLGLMGLIATLDSAIEAGTITTFAQIAAAAWPQ